MVDYVLKYGTGNLIIIYCCMYSGLLATIDIRVEDSRLYLFSVFFLFLFYFPFIFN